MNNVPLSDNIFDVASPGGAAAGLAPVRLGEDEIALIPFTPKCETVQVHYCDEPEIKGYVACPGSGCVLCSAGKKVETRRLLPVYVPAEQRVGVLMISPSLRPEALLPQLAESLKPLMADGDAQRRVVLFVRRTPTNTFSVTTAPLPEGVDDGAAAIKRFLELVETRKVDVRSVVLTVPGDQLRNVRSIQKILAIKGIA